MSVASLDVFLTSLQRLCNVIAASLNYSLRSKTVDDVMTSRRVLSTQRTAFVVRDAKRRNASLKAATLSVPSGRGGGGGHLLQVEARLGHVSRASLFVEGGTLLRVGPVV